MGANHFVKAGLLTLFLVTAFFASWEIYLRSRGLKVAYDDGKELWSDKRARVYQPSNEATVFIGSSRIKYDLDIPTWRKLTGEDAVQLASEGTSPLPVLDNLAADERFKGKLVIDVTEGLFFSDGQHGANDIQGFIKYYNKETPSEKASFVINHGLESGLVFLDRDNFSLNSFLDKLHVKDRPGIYGAPDFPLEFGRVTFDRQDKMTESFLTDTTLPQRVTAIWKMFASMPAPPPASGALLDSFFTVIKARVDKIRSRGGQVVFVRTPSSGPYWMGEQQGYPREKYWDRLLNYTNTPGVHFTDYPAIAHFVCPEWSHLAPKDAVIFTTNFVPILEEKGWKFSHNTTALSLNQLP
ncbi:MAG: hypothetical protein M3Y85_01515 [Bacteroidota bacterium]|nr:hypothetical protein [Bacteroidota bacterium]